MSSSDGESQGDVQSQLQSVLVSVKIQDTQKTCGVKKVRFNNLVEVRFIPKVKAKKDKNKEERERRRAEEKTNEKENFSTSSEGEQRGSEKSDFKNEFSGDKKKGKEKYAEGLENSDNSTAREGFSLPKVTIGQEYDGDVSRTTKIVPKPQPRNSIRLLKRGNKESRMQELTAKAVVHLERQAVEHIKEADKLFEETKMAEKKDGGSSPLGCENASETKRNSPPNLVNPSLQRCKSVPEISRRTSLPEMKGTETQNVKNSSENSHKKLSTSLPYINMIPTLTGKQTEEKQKDSYTKLYLPQLQRKAEEIKRLNDTVLRKKPKYSPDKPPTSPSDSSGNSDGGRSEKMPSPSSGGSHSIVRYSHGLDIARLLNITNSTQLYY